MHDMRVALDVHQRFDFDRAALGHPPDVVPAQVHEHNVLGPFLLIGQQAPLQLLILFGGGATAARAGNRTYRDESVFAPHQNFWRRPHQFNPCNPQIVHIRRRIDDAERAVQLERSRMELGFPALREHALKNISRFDVFLCLADHLFKVGLAHIRGEGNRCPPALGRRAPQRTAKPGDHPFNPRRCLAIGLADCPLGLRGHVGIGDHLNLLRDIVEDEQRIGQKKRKLGEVQTLFPAKRDVLERADHVVSEIADGSADETGQAGHGDRTIGVHEVPETVERRAFARDTARPFPLLDQQIAAILHHDNRRSAAEERVPRPLFSALHAFQQIRGRTMIDLREGRDRRLIVGQNFPV